MRPWARDTDEKTGLYGLHKAETLQFVERTALLEHFEYLNPLRLIGHYMYRTVVTICTAQWSLYVPHSGRYMYRTVVTICTAQWSLYVPQGLTFTILLSVHTV